MVLAISGIGLLDAMDVDQGLDAVLKLPLSFAMFTIGFVFIWIAAEIYERHAKSFKVKNFGAERRPAHPHNKRRRVAGRCSRGARVIGIWLWEMSRAIFDAPMMLPLGV
jgi:hypothetical protein